MTPFRLAGAALICAALTAPSFAQQGCAFEDAIYAERENGFEARFRPGESWEMGGMTIAIFDLVMADGTTLWGRVGTNMGVSRDEGSLFFGCKRPGPDDGALEQAQIDRCRVWNNVIYAITNGQPDYLPFADEPAPPALLFADLGRKIRYSGLVESPGDEPWDYFTFARCAQ